MDESYCRKMVYRQKHVVILPHSENSLLTFLDSQEAGSNASKGTTSNKEHGSSSLGAGAIAGAVIGALAGLAAVLAIILFMIRRRKKGNVQEFAARDNMAEAAEGPPRPNELGPAQRLELPVKERPVEVEATEVQR